MSKRKAHNVQKRRQRVAQAAMRNLAISYVTGDDYCKLVDTKAQKTVTVGQLLAEAIERIPYRWSIFMGVFGRDGEGRNYMKCKIILTSTPYYQRDLVDALNEEHSALIGGMNQNQMIGAGWLASPLGEDWEESKAFELFEKLGAFQRERTESGEIMVVAA